MEVVDIFGHTLGHINPTDSGWVAAKGHVFRGPFPSSKQPTSALHLASHVGNLAAHSSIIANLTGFRDPRGRLASALPGPGLSAIQLARLARRFPFLFPGGRRSPSGSVA